MYYCYKSILTYTKCYQKEKKKKKEATNSFWNQNDLFTHMYFMH